MAGSAQRRRHAALLQHGSVLLERSSQAPELPGLSELAGFDAGGQWLAETWSTLLARRLNLSFERASLSAQEGESAGDYRDGRFGDGSWTRRR